MQHVAENSEFGFERIEFLAELVFDEVMARIAGLASHGGSTFQAIAEAVQNGSIHAELSCLMTSNGKAYALTRAEQLGVFAMVIEPKAFPSFDAWDAKMLEVLRSLDVDVVLLAGFTRQIGPKVLQAFEGRILNTHPSLLPKYGGQGMYGIRVHQAVIENKEEISGISIHQVTANYDEGPVIAQREVPVLEGDRAEDLQARIQEVEKPFYIEVIQQFLQQNIYLS